MWLLVLEMDESFCVFGLPAGPSVGMKENAELIAPAFANPDGAWLGGPQAALVGDYEGQKAVVLLNLDG